MTKRKKRKLKRFMVDGHNPVTGELDVPIVFLWLTKDGVYRKNNMGGAMESGTEIKLVRRDPDGWVYIKCDITFRGKVFHQKGYVRESLIKEYEPGVING